MPRTARRRSSTDFYHVIARGINKEPIFKQKREKNNFLRLLLKHLKDRDIEIYAYVVMSTHFHILLRADLKLLSNYLAIVLAEFAEYYNFKHNRNGHVFQDRFKSECVESQQYFWNCVRYIHMNPVNANAVKVPVIGMGGIASAEDAIEMILAGASAVSVGTANFYDPAVTMEIVDGIENYMKEQGFDTVADMVGIVK